MEFKRIKANTEEEKDLITGLIIKDDFCKQLLPLLRPEHLQIPHFRPVLRWVREYFEKYHEAPRVNIEKVFKVEEKNLGEDEKANIERFIEGLSKRHEEGMSQIDLDLSSQYIRKRNLQILSEKIDAYVSLDRLDDAEVELARFKTVAKQTAKWVDLSSEETIEEVLFSESSEEYLVKLPGVLGEFLGGLKRKWLLAVMAPMKRGKTWTLDEIGFISEVAGLKVLDISLEMEKTEKGMRKYKRMTGLDDIPGTVVLPVFDCRLNQTGECPESPNKTSLRDENGDKPSFRKAKWWKICTKCRGTRRFETDQWWEESKKAAITYAKVRRAMQGLKAVSSGERRLLTYPINSVNIQDIKRDMDVLEYMDNFIPDVIIIDYADLLRSEDSRLTGRDAINETWKSLKAMAQERNCLVVTATQANRQSIERTRVKQIDTGEDIRKLAHVNVMMVLNQTPVEKKLGIMRIGLLAHRNKRFDELEQVYVLQNLDIGQPHLDSERGQLE